MRKPIIVGNWKMNGTLDSTEALLAQLTSELNPNVEADVGVCVPFPFLSLAQKLLENSPVYLGAQNVADQQTGAFTGEVSASMLKEFNCVLAIVGHSERRALYAESNELISNRCQQALDAGLTPIVCVGESLQQRERGETFEIVDQQLNSVIEQIGVQSMHKTIIAYEPVWAIGTGRTASTDQAQEVHEYIRSKIADSEKSVADSIRILYGGSVKPDNAADLFSMSDIDGGLIGGASLDAASFLTICRSTQIVG